MPIVRATSSLFLLILFVTGCRSAHNPSGSSAELQAASSSDVFKETDQKMFDMAVHEIFLHVDGETFQQMTNLPHQGGYSCKDNVPYGHVKDFHFKNTRTGETAKFNNVGVRVKGNTTCDDPIDHRSFKIKMNPVDKISSSGKRTQKVYEKFGQSLNYAAETAASIKEQNLFGLESFAIRRSGIDPSRIRDLLASDVFEYGGELARKRNTPGAPHHGGPVYRGSVGYAKFYTGFGVLTEGHVGLVELVDGDLIKSHYGKKALSHLFKIKEGKGTFLSSEMPQNDRKRLLSYYSPEVIDGKEFEDDDGNQAERAAAVLMEFRSKLSDAVAPNDRDERRKRVGELLDVDNILSYMVSVNLVGHWDSLVGATSNNDYIFEHGETKKWGILTWDLDNTFGAGQASHLWMAGMREFGVPMKYRPLFQAVLDNFPDEYKDRVKDYLAGVYGFKQINDRITAYRNLITGGANDERFEFIYKFASHRFANAWCQVFKGDEYYTVVETGHAKVAPDGLSVTCEKK